MRFVLIRHAQSGNNLIIETTGGDEGRQPDPLLTPLGEEQAAALASYASQDRLPWELTHLRTSLMARAVQTAAPLADALDLPLEGDTELHECLGPYDVLPDSGTRVPHPGAPRSVLTSYSSRLVLPEDVTEDGWWTAEVESTEQEYVDRARRVVERLRVTLPADATVGLVTHGWFTQYLLRELLGIGEMSGWFAIPNTAVSMLAELGRREPWSGTEALRIGWLPHLAPGQVST
ncbi:phosphoglycerate mutase family protein [Nocardioides rotundus]|uniref:histidine phosphatase family protein n=1 Tax=Nocardioides rotundus TaxID=1774216 RepID=UPI001CBF1AC0|nr:histidine phosphatase family protein [Nocardioides rotundus]UAL30711.1 phosphoglycerate mutase family protein [Nocardioides rotundus]